MKERIITQNVKVKKKKEENTEGKTEPMNVKFNTASVKLEVLRKRYL